MNYTQEQLEQAFKKVQNKEHWKNPIDACCRMEDMDIVKRAIIHFTSTVPSFSPVNKEWLRVWADGYRLGPAGDH